jgi:hypothetical protein
VGRETKTMKIKMMVSILALGALSVTSALYGQDPAGEKEKKQQQEQQADRPNEVTLTGCLTEQAGAFTLATTAGEQISATGSPDLGKHKDHTVKLTGRTSDEGGKKSLNVSKIEMVAASCSK